MYVNPLKLEMKQKHMDRQMKKTKAKIDKHCTLSGWFQSQDKCYHKQNKIAPK